MTMKSNRREVSQTLRREIDDRLEKSGLLISNAAKQFSPIDTGRLRASIQSVKEGNTVYIGTNVYYGVYQELGTRYQSGTPFLRPGLNNSRGALIALWKTPVNE